MQFANSKEIIAVNSTFTKMPNCILRYCKNYSQRTKKSSDGVTFHTFPRPGHEKREQWIKFVRNDRSEDAWLPSEHTCICSEHFREQDCYLTKTGRRYLKKDAVPVTNPKVPQENIDISPTLLCDVHLSESESTFDTPGEIKLKNDLRETNATKKKLIEKNKKLTRRCRYLKLRNQKLTEQIKKLKSIFPVACLVENKTDLKLAVGTCDSEV